MKHLPSQMNKSSRPHPRRFIVLCVVFCLVCAVYSARLVMYQIAGRSNYISASAEPTYTSTVPIKAVRGSICDRNGKVLVGNSYSYCMRLDYNTLPDTKPEINVVMLAMLDAFDKYGAGASRTADYSPFVGTYPDISYSEELSDTTSELYSKWERLLTINFLKKTNTLDELKQKYTAKELVDYYTNKYLLVNKKGELQYTAEEITALLSLKYNLEVSKFSYYGSYVFAENVTTRLITAVKEAGLDGVVFETESQRVYSYPGYASHILGGLGQITEENAGYYLSLGYPLDAYVGIDGCEAAFEDYLRGVDGEMTIVTDKNGNITDEYISKQPTPGRDVYLTLDIDLQIVAEDALAENILDVARRATTQYSGEDANAGAVVVSDANSGQLYAIASAPTYNLFTLGADYNSLAANENLPLYNRATAGLYAPGSTFKVLMALAALDSGVVTPYQKIHTEGIYRTSANDSLRCWYYTSSGGLSHGDIDVAKALEVSCNYYFCYVGEKMGISVMNAYSKQFGLGAATGIELPEKLGILAGEEARNTFGLGAWRLGDTVQAAIGQSDNLFTPLQINSYIKTVANGGTHYAAHLLYKTVDYASGEAVFVPEEKILDTVTFNAENYNAVKNGMKNAVINSTSSYMKQIFADAPYSVGAKTGTAQVFKDSSDNGVFVAFAPLDSPEIVISCVIEHGASGGNASYTARAVFDSYFENKAEADKPDIAG